MNISFILKDKPHHIAIVGKETCLIIWHRNIFVRLLGPQNDAYEREKSRHMFAHNLLVESSH